MALPSVPRLTFTIKHEWAPTKGFKLTPFNIGQESLLLQAKESDSKQDQYDAMLQIIKECSVDPIDPEQIPMFVIEDIFLRLYEKSVGEEIQFQHTCKEALEDGTTCDHVKEYTVQTKDIKLKKPEGLQAVFELGEGVGIKFKFPTLKTAYDASGDEKRSIIHCIDSIFDENSVYPAENETYEDLEKFFDQISLGIKKEIYESFFSKQPHLYHRIEDECPKCKAKKVFEFMELSDVFI